MSSIRILCLFVLIPLWTTLILSGCSKPRSESKNGIDTETVGTESIHPIGWLNSGSSEFHGKAYIASAEVCTECHGKDLLGGIAGVGCSSSQQNGRSCHPGNSEPHMAPLRNADGSIHPDNARLLCGKCHDHNDFQNDVKFQCQRCHTDPTITPDPLNGTLKDQYPESYPYGFGSAMNVTTHGSRTVGTKYGNWDANCVACHNPHAQEQDAAFGTTYGKLVKRFISFFKENTGETIESSIQLTSSTGTGSFADGPPHNENICETCHSQTLYHQNDGSAPGGQSHYDGENCTECHRHDQGFKPDCTQCHGVPPQTGTHLKHFSGTPLQADYGSTAITQDVTSQGTAYLMNCGNCHPMDTNHHRNGVTNAVGGTAEIEFYNPNAPKRSLKALHSPSAVYTPGDTLFTDDDGMQYTHGTCTNVYCHSDPASSSPESVKTNIELPVSFDHPWMPLVETSRQNFSPTWGVDKLDCGGCHGYPATTGDDPSFAETSDGNKGFGALQCKGCHAGTVLEDGERILTGQNTDIYGDIAISNTANHVNGTKEIIYSAHPEGWSTGHGSYFLTEDGLCTACHGGDLHGGISDVSCNTTQQNGTSCHPGNDSPHMSNVLLQDDEVHPDNASLFCAKCHDPDDFQNDLKFQCQRCHVDPNGTSDPLNGTLKDQYPDTFPYGFGSAASVATHSSETVGEQYGAWGAECVTCHNPHNQEQNNAFSTDYGKLIKRSISFDNQATGETVGGEFQLISSSGLGSFADGPPHGENVCEVCHTRTNHHRNSGKAPADLDDNGNYKGHFDGQACTGCHSHLDGFTPAGGDIPPPHSTSFFLANCKFCHLVDESGNDAFFQFIPSEECQKCHGTRKRHASDISETGKYNYDIECVDCHNPMFEEGENIKGIRRSVPQKTVAGSLVLFSSEEGEGSFADGASFNENICETCHTNTEHHRADGQAPGDLDSFNNYIGHYDGEKCTRCHNHDNSFLPE